MATFALVPGAWHGAWCWERVAPLLRGAGHDVVAMDLPCEDTASGCAAYRDVVLEAIGDADGDLVVVGHSAGGPRSSPPPGPAWAAAAARSRSSPSGPGRVRGGRPPRPAPRSLGADL